MTNIYDSSLITCPGCGKSIAMNILKQHIARHHNFKEPFSLSVALVELSSGKMSGLEYFKSGKTPDKLIHQPPALVIEMQVRNTTNWKHTQCSKCNGQVHYLEKWAVRPSLCVCCRLKEIINMRLLFEKYLAYEDKIKRKCHSPEERKWAAKRENLIVKVNEALKTGVNLNLLVKSCLDDPELSRLAFRLAKEDRINHLPPQINKRHLQTDTPELSKVVHRGQEDTHN